MVISTEKKEKEAVVNKNTPEGTAGTGANLPAPVSYQGYLDQMLGYGPFTYTNQGVYDQTFQQVTNPEAFSYDPSKDESWAAFRKAYLREGDRASQNAMARASVATGGVPSSYAVTAAQQAQNYYNSQLMDKLPELEQNAYQRYLGQQQLNLNAWNAAQADRNTQYGEWQDGYGILGTNLSAAQGVDAQKNQQQQQNYSNLVTLITTTGFVPDAATLAAAGMSPEEAAAWKAYFDKNNAPKTYNPEPVPTEKGNTREQWVAYITGVFAEDGVEAANAHIDALIAADPSLAWLAQYKRQAGVSPNAQAGGGGVGMKEVPRQTVSLR